MGKGNVIIYQAPDGQTAIDVVLDHDTVWLTQAQIMDLFDSSKANISEHIKNIFTSNELEQDSTVRKIRTVRQEGKRKVTREIEHYNLDMIISIGYGTQFRMWANKVLKDYLAKGYVLNEKRLEEKTQQFDALK